MSPDSGINPTAAPSWQSRLVRPLLRLVQAISPDLSQPFAATRSGMERLIRYAPGGGSLRFTPEPVNGCAAGWYDVAGGALQPAILYLHGGGYTLGTFRMNKAFFADLGRATHRRIFALDYRLAPEHPFPAALEDATAAYEHLLEAGISPEQISVVGESAGGGLGAALLLCLRRAGLPLPGCAVLFSPWLDLAQSGEAIRERASREKVLTLSFLERCAAAYLNGKDALDPLASPLYGDLAGMPAVQIQTGTEEMLFDDARRYYQRLLAAGSLAELVVWPAMPHGWHTYGSWLPEARLALQRAAGFIRG